MQFEMAYAFLCIQRASCCIVNISIRAVFSHFQLMEPNVVIFLFPLQVHQLRGYSTGRNEVGKYASIPGELDDFRIPLQ